MDKEIIQQQDDPLADAGRSTDNVMGHMSLGEVVIPRAMLDDPEFMQYLAATYEGMGSDINEFTVGHKANKINPETGYPEFFFKKILKTNWKSSTTCCIYSRHWNWCGYCSWCCWWRN